MSSLSSFSSFSDIQRNPTPSPPFRLHPFLLRPTVRLDLTEVPPSRQYSGWDSNATEPPVSKLYLIFSDPLPPRLVVVVRNAGDEPLQCHHIIRALAGFLTADLSKKERESFAIQMHEKLRKRPSDPSPVLVPRRAVEGLKDMKFLAGVTQPENSSGSKLDAPVLCIHFSKK